MKRKIFLLICVVLIAALLIGVLAACDPGSKEQSNTKTPGDTTTPGEPGITAPVNPGQDGEEQNPGQGDEGQEPGQDDEEQNPGQGDEGQGEGDEGQDPGQDDEWQKSSEEEYRQDNIIELKNILVNGYNEHAESTGGSLKIGDIDNIILNLAAAEVYFTADMVGVFGSTNYCFTAGISGESFNGSTQEELNEYLTSFYENGNKINFVGEKRISLSNMVDEKKFNALMGHFQREIESEEYGKVDFSSVPSENFYNVTYFFNAGDPNNSNIEAIECQMIVGEKVYTVQARNLPMGGGAYAVESFLQDEHTVFMIVSIKPFKEFDINTVITG